MFFSFKVARIESFVGSMKQTQTIASDLIIFGPSVLDVFMLHCTLLSNVEYLYIYHV